MLIGALIMLYVSLPLTTGQIKTLDWQSVIKKLEWRLERRQVEVLLGGGLMVLL